MDSGAARSVRLPANYNSVRAARRFVAESVDGGDSSDLQLLVSELVTNVVRHVGNEVTLTVRHGQPLRVEVHNHQAASKAFRDLIANGRTPDPTKVDGRGLAIVRSLATAVGLDDDPNGGKVVWFEYNLATSN